MELMCGGVTENTGIWRAHGTVTRLGPDPHLVYASLQSSSIRIHQTTMDHFPTNWGRPVS